MNEENKSQPEAIEKDVVKLVEVPYLGEGYFHWFRNNETQELVSEECTEEEYNAMIGEAGALNNPTKKGHTWLYSWGGTVKVDTPSGFLSEGQFTRRGTDTVVHAGEKDIVVVSNEKVDDRNEFDKSSIRK